LGDAIHGNYIRKRTDVGKRFALSRSGTRLNFGVFKLPTIEPNSLNELPEPGMIAGSSSADVVLP